MTTSAWRLVRSLAWLRWRILVNTLTRSGARDLLERLSRTAESVLPIAIAVMLVPVGVSLMGVGSWAGWTLGDDPANAGWPVHAVRWSLLAMLLVTVLSPVILPSAHQPAGLIRLLLLPIPGRVLYLAHAAGALADPWVFLSIPLLLGVVSGLAASGQFAAAVAATVAGLGVLVTLLGVAAIASAVLQLLVRNRRRAELLALGGMLLVVAISIVPSLVFTGGDTDREATRARRRGGIELASWLRAAGALAPSELYVSGVRHAAGADRVGAFAAAAGIVVWALALHALAGPTYQRLLQTPATSGTRRRASGSRPLVRALPGVGRTASAVALVFVRLAYRTPRGRAVILMPIVVLAGFAAISGVREQTIPFGPVTIAGGYSLGVFGIVIALMSIGPLVFNQFAVDGAGLTLQFLAPIGTRALLRGKAIGGALIAALPCLLAVAAGVVTGGHSPVVWTAIALAACASYLVTAPVAAVLSVLFPRAVDLSSIGQASNAHQAAGLLGFLAFAASCAPPAALAVTGVRGLGSTGAALGLIGAWTGMAWALSAIGFRIAERLLDERRENLAMVSQGR